MGKKITIVPKEKEKKPAPIVGNAPQTAEKKDTPKDDASWLKYRENQITNDPRFISASDEEKKIFLGNFFDKYKDKFIAGQSTPEQYMEAKSNYIKGTLNKFLNEGMVDIPQKKSTDTLPSIQSPAIPPKQQPDTTSGEKQDTTSVKPTSSFPQPAAKESDIITTVRDRAEKAYKDKGWPSPTWKMSEYQKYMDDIKKKIDSGEIQLQKDKMPQSPEWRLKKYEEEAFKLGQLYKQGKIKSEQDLAAAQEKLYADLGLVPDPKNNTVKISDAVIEDYNNKLNKAYNDAFMAIGQRKINELGLLYNPETGSVYVSDHEVEMYRDEIERQYRLDLQERKAKEKDGFFKDVLDALGIGSESVMTTPTRLLAISESIGNGMAWLIGQKKNWGSTYWKDRANAELALIDMHREMNQRYDAKITDYIASGETGKAVGQTVLSVAENLPLLTTLVMGNAAGATNATLGLMGGDKAATEYLNTENDPGLTEMTRIVNAIGKGMSEIVFENMGTVSILNNVRKGIEDAGKETIRQQLQRAYASFFERQLTILGKGASATATESAEEMATQLTDNMIDIASGKDVKLGDGVGDAGIVGGIIGFGLSSPAVWAEYKGGKNEYINKIKELIPENLDFETKVEFVELIVEADKIRVENKDLSAMDMATKERLNKINMRMEEILGIVTPEETVEAPKSPVKPFVNPEDLKIDPNYLEWMKEERARYDEKILEIQQKFGLPTTPEIFIPEEVEDTLERIEMGEPIINVRLKEASDLLYKEYKRLNAMKQATKKEYTDQQIDDMMEELGTDIEKLNTLINEQAESGEFQTKEVKLTDEITVSEITEIGKGETTEGKPGETKTATGEDITEEVKPGEEPPAEEKKPTTAYGDTEKVLETKLKDFKTTFDKQQTDTDLKAAAIEDRIAILNKRKDALTGRLTTEQRRLKREIEDDIIRAERELDEVDQAFTGEIKTFIDEARPKFEGVIKELEPDIDEKGIKAVLDELWVRMTDPLPEEADWTIEDTLLNVMAEREGAPVKQEITPEEKIDNTEAKVFNSLTQNIKYQNEIVGTTHLPKTGTSVGDRISLDVNGSRIPAVITRVGPNGEPLDIYSSENIAVGRNGEEIEIYKDGKYVVTALPNHVPTNVVLSELQKNKEITPEVKFKRLVDALVKFNYANAGNKKEEFYSDVAKRYLEGDEFVASIVESSLGGKEGIERIYRGEEGPEPEEELPLTEVTGIKDLEQKKTFDCGVNALRTVFSKYGIDETEDSLIKQTKATEKNGTMLKDMVRVAKEKGLQAEMKEGMTPQDLRDLIDQDIPVIILQNGVGESEAEKDYSGNKDGHYITITGYEADGFIFEDPANTTDGKHLFMTEDELLERWHGEDDNFITKEGIGIIITKPKGQEKSEVKEWKYKLTLRPFDIGTQPKAGFVKAELEPGERYETLTYNRKLTAEERKHFDLRPITEIEQIEGKEFVDKDGNYSRITLAWTPTKGSADVSMYDLDGELVEEPFLMSADDILRNIEEGYWIEKPGEAPPAAAAVEAKPVDTSKPLTERGGRFFIENLDPKVINLNSQQRTLLEGMVQSHYNMEDIAPIIVSQIETDEDYAKARSLIQRMIQFAVEQATQAKDGTGEYAGVSPVIRKDLMDRWGNVQSWAERYLEDFDTWYDEEFNGVAPEERKAEPILTDAEKWREKGERTVNGVKYTRQPELKKVKKGKVADIQFGKKVFQKGHYAIIEASELQASHVGESPNPLHFIPEAQPRNRGGMAALRYAEIEKGEHLDPRQVGVNLQAYSGAPIVNARGEVIQGSGRAQGIKYYLGQYKTDPQGYLNHLIEIAPFTGLDVAELSEFKNPVLVRMVDVTDQEAIVLGNYTQTDIEDVNPESADIKKASNRITKADAITLSNILIRGAEPEDTLNSLIRKKADELLNKLAQLGVFTQGEAEKYQKKGEITPFGIQAIERVYKGIFFQTGNQDLYDIFENFPDVVKKGIERSMPILLRIPTDKSILPQILKALMGYNEYLNFMVASGQVGVFYDWVNQGNMFEEPVTSRYNPFELAVIEKLSNVKRQGDVVRLFKEYEDLVNGKPEDLFEGARPGISRKDAAAKIFGVEYQKTIDDDYSEKIESEVSTERQGEKPVEEPEKGDAAEESVPPEVKIIEVKKDIEDLSNLIDDLDFDDGQSMASGGESGVDTRTKIFNIATGLIKKMVDGNIYQFDRMIAEILPSIDVARLNKLLPFLKQAYINYKGTAPDEIADRMSTQLASAFDATDIDRLIAGLNKPKNPSDFSDIVGKRFYVPAVKKWIQVFRVELWDDPRDQKIEMMGGLFGSLPKEFEPLYAAVLNIDPMTGQKLGMSVDKLRAMIESKDLEEVPPYENPEYQAELQKIIDFYRGIGDNAKADKLEADRYLEPKRSLKGEGTWQQEIEMLNRGVKYLKDERDILSGRTMYPPIPAPAPLTKEDIFDMVESMVKRGAPLTPFIEEYVSADLIQKIVDATNVIQKLRADLGVMRSDLPHYMDDKFRAHGLTGHLYRVGSQARKLESNKEGATKEKVLEAVEDLKKAVAEQAKAIEYDREAAFNWDLRYHILNGLPLESWMDVVKLAKKWGVTSNGAIRDQYELALVEISRSIARDFSIPFIDRWTQILNLYNTVPGISANARTSNVKELQQYSTPVPLGLLMGEYVNISQASLVLEPSAGMGALLIGADIKSVRANEIDERRAAGLRKQGYSVFMADSSHGLSNYMDVKNVPAIVMNPPFGGEKETYAGYPLTGEYVNVAHNLEQLSDTGKAAIIVGGHIKFNPDGSMSGKDLMFFNWLNKYFNVEDVLQLSGDMYKKMGASYPIKLILVNGRKAMPVGNAPLYSKAFEPLTEWSDVRDRILTATTKANEKNILQSKVDAQRGDDSLMGRGNPGQDEGGVAGGYIPIRPGQTSRAPIEGDRGASAQSNTDGLRRDPGAGRRRGDVSNNVIPTIPKSDGGIGQEGGGRASRAGTGFGEIRTRRNKEDLPVSNIGKPDERTKRELGLNERTGDEVTPYVPLSRLGSGHYIVPATIAVELETALKELHDEVGDVDQYVMRKLKYNSLEEMKGRFFAEQIDGIAQAIYNIENGSGMIIGHQTGTGKGRIAAAAVRYAIENGKFPVFITKSADLFTDIYRDMVDIGSPSYKPFITNKIFASSGQKVKIFHPETGEVVHEVDPDENDRIIGKGKTKGNWQMPEGTQMLFTTYSQFAAEDTSAARRDFLMNLARQKDVVFIMDESHEASGDSNTGQFFMDWLQSIGGGIFLSATYAKRPDNMPLYAMKTVLREANMDWTQLVDAIKAGGTALQEIITLQLAEAGQFSKVGFKMDAEMNYLIIGDDDPTQKTYDPAKGQQMINQYDQVTSLIKDIIDFQKVFVNPVIKAMQDELKRRGMQAGQRKGTSQAGISNTPYFSRVWNILDQLLVSIKVKDSLPLIIDDLKKGIKPVIALKSTMEAMFDQMVKDGELAKGEIIDLDFSYVLKKGMKTVMKYTVKDEQGQPAYMVLTPEELDDTGRNQYYRLMERIQKTTTNIPTSPIDILRKGIKDAGFDVVEITGRNSMFLLNKEMTKGEYVGNDRGDKIKAVRKFNNNTGVAAIINRAGSTGISMHSSPKFADTSQRSMYILQNDLDINVVVQILGRIYRADQLNKPIYNILTSKLPAELRMFMMNARKLKSLDANTSGNQKQSKNLTAVPDFLNKYGDEVVYEYLRENPEINNMLDDPLNINDDEPNKADAAHRVTYRVQILPSELQEEFNRDVIDRYERYIEYLNATGRNDLMVTSENLEAEIKEGDVTINGHGGFSAFGDDTILNKIEANVLRKPYSKVELDEILAQIPADHTQSIRTAMESGMREKLIKDIAAVNAEYEGHRNAWKARIAEKPGLTDQDKAREYDLKVNELNERETNRILGINNAFDANIETFKDYLHYFRPGMPVYVPFSDAEQTDMFRMNVGVFIGFDVNMNKPNPWIPSNFILKFATADSRRMVRIPASKSNHLGAIMHNSRRLDDAKKLDVINNWDKQQSQRNRETRYVVTRNILQGMALYKQGRLIQFTKKDGTIDKGILMNENWIRPDDRIARIPINRAIDIIKALAPGEFIESYGGEIIIKKLHLSDPQRFYELKVPAATKTGSKFYTNDLLKDIVGLFEQHGDRMVGQFGENRLQELIDVLGDRFKITLEIDSKNVQRAQDPTDADDTMNSYGQEPRKKAKKRGGLSNPYNDVIGAEEKKVGSRVQPAPITGESPKKMWDIQFDLASAVGYKLRYARKPSTRGSAIGTFYPGTGRVVIKWHGDMNTTAHEMGHAMDDAFGLLGPEAQPVWSQLKDELSQLWDYGSKPPKGHPNPELYKMGEGMAEFIRAFVVNPHEAQKRFPFTYSWVKERITKDPQTWEGLLQFSRDIRVWWGATASEQILSRLNTEPPEGRKAFVFRRENDQGQFQITMADRLASKYTNVIRPIEMAYEWAMEKKGIDLTTLSPMENWIFLNRLLLGQDVKLRNAMEHGIVNFNGDVVSDSETGAKLSFPLLMGQLPNHTWADMQKNLEIALSYGMAERITEIPRKMQARQIRMDLAVKGAMVMPPEHIMRLHPHIEDMFKEKLKQIRDKLNKGELDPKDVYLPEERYDFRAMVISGHAQEGMTDYAIAEKAVEEYKALETTDPDKYKWISEFNRVYREIASQIIKYARDSGMISEASYQQIEAENLYYMAMKRLFVMDPAEIAEGVAQDSIAPVGFSARDERGLVKVVIHPIKGSRREIRNPVEALIGSYHEVVRNGDLNFAINQLAKAFSSGRDQYSDGTIKTGEIAWISKSPEQRSLPFFVNGKKRYLVVPDPELFDLFKNMIPSPGESGAVMNLLKWLPQKLRTSVITAPVFALRNIIRDIHHFMVIGTGLRYLAPADFIPRFLKTRKQKEYADKMRHLFLTQGGGQFGYLVASKRGYYELMVEAMFKVSEDPKKWIQTLRVPDPEGKIIKTKWGPAASSLYEATYGWMMKGEQITRMLQFKAAVRQGMDKVKVKYQVYDAVTGKTETKERPMTEAEAVIRAAYLSRDLMDFMVSGSHVRELNKVIVFLNPAIRGLDRIYRSTKDPKTRKSILARAALLLAIPGILNSLLIAMIGSDDEKEEYLAAADYERDMFYRIPVGKGWVLIPRPFELAAITSAFQRATDKLILGDKNAFTENYYKSIMHLLSPVDVAGIFGGFSGAIAALFNYDFFRQKHIVPPDDIGMSIALANTSYTSQFSQAVMEASDIFTKGEGHYVIDPRKLDAFIQGQFTYYGNFFLKTTDLLIPGEEERSNFKFDITSTGFYKYANAYGEPNTQWLLSLYKTHPYLKTRLAEDYKQFSYLLKKYFADESQADPKRRREIGKALREYSGVRREAWGKIDFYKEDAAVKAIEELKRQANQ